jgi:signal transduction histidine kinase
VRRISRDRSLRAQAAAFAASFDPALLDPRVWIPIRISTAAPLVALAWLAASAPGFRDFFQLEPAVPLALLAACVALVFALGLQPERGRRRPVAFAGGMLVYVVLEEMMTASFVVYAKPPGAFVLAALPILRAAIDGIALGSSAGQAALTAAHGLGVLAALALRPDIDHRWVLLLTTPIVMALFLFFASTGARLTRGRALVAEQRAAIEAQHVVERFARLEDASATLGELRQRRHAARSALATARLVADRLTALARGDAELRPRAETLTAALTALERLLAEPRSPSRSAGSTRGPALDRVEVAPLVLRVIEAASEAAPGLRATLRIADGREPPAALVRGGPGALYQILEHLLINARDGDGRRGAGQITVSLEADPDARVLAIRVEDDGPGFRPEVLERPIAPFFTTKARGLGLGLYTVERLTRASGGSLRLENREGGGAAVTVYLELASTAPTALPAAPPAREEEPCDRSGSSIASGS